MHGLVDTIYSIHAAYGYYEILFMRFENNLSLDENIFSHIEL